MEAKRGATLAAVLIVFCYWAVLLRFQNGTSEKVASEKNGNLNEQYEYVNLVNSQGKIGKQLWESIYPAFKCPGAQLTRVGKTGDGGKWTCGLYHLGSYYEQNPSSPCVVYSFGVGSDSSFEAQVLTNTRCSVYAYDPTVKSIATPLSPLNPRLHFFKMGVEGNNTKNRKTLKTVMEENGGHEWIDIVKMDIEGSEYASFDNIFQDFDQLPFGQLLVEIHYPEERTAAFSEKIVLLIRELEKRGLRMFYREINEMNPECCSEFSFVNIIALEKFMDVE